MQCSFYLLNAVLILFALSSAIIPRSLSLFISFFVSAFQSHSLSRMAGLAPPTTSLHLFQWYEANRDGLIAAGHAGKWILVWYGNSPEQPPPAAASYRFKAFNDEQEMMNWTCDAAHHCFRPFHMDKLGQEEQIRQIMKRMKRNQGVS